MTVTLFLMNAALSIVVIPHLRHFAMMIFQQQLTLLFN